MARTISLSYQFALMYGKQSTHFLALEPIARALRLYPDDSFVLNGAASIYASFVQCTAFSSSFDSLLQEWPRS